MLKNKDEMHMILKRQLLLNTEVTKNNRRYPLEILESVRDQINGRDSSLNFGFRDYPTDEVFSDLEKLIVKNAAFAYSNAIVEEESLYIDIIALSTHEGMKFAEMIKEGLDLRFRPIGTGTLKGKVPAEVHNLLEIPNVVSEDYQLLSIGIVDPSQDAIIVQENK